MHCTSIYPCPPHLANVSAIRELRYFGYPVGYSDHTIGDMAACAAVALGATVIEKHFTLDHESDGPDHHMSATPAEFRMMVENIRKTELLLGHGRKEPSEEELAMIPRIRKDIEGFQSGL
jgi:sialic acid synthase SpsE